VLRKYKLPLLATLAVIITFIAFSPILQAGFTNWDDQIMVTQNEKITSLSPHNTVAMFTTFHERLYHPLVLISYAKDYHFFGMSPTAFHATSLLLHLANTALVFWFIWLLSASSLIAFAVSLLFGIHPMHVESVAWISERKDVLYTLFFMASLISYVIYVKTKDFLYHLIALSFFVLSLLSKSMAMTLPLILIIIDLYLGRKIDKKSLSDKAFFFILAVIFGIITILGHYEPSVHGREFSFSLFSNLMLACQSYIFYLIKFIAPVKLSCLYPMPDQIKDIPGIFFTLSPLILLAFAYIVFVLRRSKIILFGSLFFFISLLPVSQILPVGLKVPADRYTYVPYIGLFFILMSGLNWLWRKKEKHLKFTAAFLISFIISLSFFLTFQRVQVWHDSKTLWKSTLKNYDNLPIAYYNLAEEYFLRDWDLDNSIPYFTKAIEADPKYAEAYINRGLVYFYKGDPKRALKDYAEAEKYRPDMYELHINKGNAYNMLGQKEKAFDSYNASLKLKRTAEGFYNRGNMYLSTGKRDKAIEDFTSAIAIKAGYSDAYNNRGNAYYETNKMDLAFADFSQAISINPKATNAYFNRALIHAGRKEYKKALDDVLHAKLNGMPVRNEVIQELEQLSNTSK
jgi:tetratricopeptide (TPR) repeat protein